MDNKIKNIKDSSAFYSKIPNYKNQYSDIIYGCSSNKICFIFSPRAGFSVCFKCFLDFLNLLEDSIYHDNVHDYRINYFLNFAKFKNFNELISEQYKIIKIIVNPYSRAVSIFKGMYSHNLNFEEFLLKVQNKDNFLSNYELFHSFNQYSEGEDNYITSYWKIDKNKSYEAKKDGNTFIFDLNKYSSEHHSIRTVCNEFVGNTKLEIIREKTPKLYKYFYNDKIKKIVDNVYNNDVIKYNYNFEDDF